MLGFVYTQGIWVHITDISKHRFRFSVCIERRLLTVTLTQGEKTLFQEDLP